MEAALPGQDLKRWKPFLTKKRSIISWYKRLKGSWIVEIKVLSRDFQLFETFKWKQP